MSVAGCVVRSDSASVLGGAAVRLAVIPGGFCFFLLGFGQGRLATVAEAQGRNTGGIHQLGRKGYEQNAGGKGAKSYTSIHGPSPGIYVEDGGKTLPERRSLGFFRFFLLRGIKRHQPGIDRGVSGGLVLLWFEVGQFAEIRLRHDRVPSNSSFSFLRASRTCQDTVASLQPMMSPASRWDSSSPNTASRCWPGSL